MATSASSPESASATKAISTLRTGRLIANYNTGGKLQADELTTAGRYLIVTNSAETPHPFISRREWPGGRTRSHP